MSTEARAPLHVVRSGLPIGPGVEIFALVHGFGASSFTWRHWLPVLEHRGHVVQIDLPACGDSPVFPDGPFDPVGQSGLVRDVVEPIGTDRLTLVGHSLGGGIALHAAVRMTQLGRPPERLVLIGSAAYSQRLPPFTVAARRPRLSSAIVRLAGERNVVAQILRSVVFDPTMVTDDLIDGYARPLGRAGVLEALFESALRIQPPDLDALTALYPSVQAPTLLLWGDRDPVVPGWVGRRLASALPEARLVTLDRCGHLPHEERREASVAVLKQFLDTVGRANLNRQ